MKGTYIVLALYNNEVQDIKSFTTLAKAEAQAISLANKWYKTDGLISTFDEMQNYYNSDAYFNSGDAVHICMEDVSAIDSSCSSDIKAFPAII